MIGFLKEMLIEEEDVKQKYGLRYGFKRAVNGRINRDMVHIRFREVVLQALIRLCMDCLLLSIADICKFSPNPDRKSTST